MFLATSSILFDLIFELVRFRLSCLSLNFMDGLFMPGKCVTICYVFVLFIELFEVMLVRKISKRYKMLKKTIYFIFN